MADELKAKGNAAFSKGDFSEAVEFFTQAIALDPSNHVLFSNRSAAEASLNDYEKALDDAKKCVELKPDWAKGYSRLGDAYSGLDEWEQALTAYEDGLKLDPSNEHMKTQLKKAISAKDEPASPGGLFSSPEFLARLATDPRTRSLISNPGFMRMISDIKANPGNMNLYMQDENFQLERSAPPPKPAAPKEPEPQPEPEVEMTEEERSRAETIAASVKEKELGNEAYKKKDFATAIGHYNKAVELYDEDISYLTNRAACHYEAGNLDACIEDCDKAVERGRELRADYKLVARALQRKGNALVKLGRLEEAVTIYNKSLTEHRNPDTLKKLQETEKTLKEQREQAYIDMDISTQEKDKGNQAFKDGNFPEAVQFYLEALKRGPPAINPEAHKLYSNLAACYTKLGAYPDGVKAADKCLELAPDFVKGYSRKAHLQYLMKDYDKALETYEKGLNLDAENDELKEGIRACIIALNKLKQGEVSEEELKLRQARSMQDPEIQAIMVDPVMRQVLQDLQNDPKGSRHHLDNPEIYRKFEKLVTAGIIQTK